MLGDTASILRHFSLFFWASSCVLLVIGKSSKLGHKYILINGRKISKFSVSNINYYYVLKERTKQDKAGRANNISPFIYICPINEPQVIERAALHQDT